MYPFVGELEPHAIAELAELEIDPKIDDLYVNTHGELFVYVDCEGHYHPDDSSAIPYYYQPTGIEVWVNGVSSVGRSARRRKVSAQSVGRN